MMEVLTTVNHYEPLVLTTIHQSEIYTIVHHYSSVLSINSINIVNNG